MFEKISKFSRLVLDSGSKNATQELIVWLRRYGTQDRKLQRIKKKLSKKYSKDFKDQIQTGLFQGMIFKNNGWGCSESFSMLLGTYEIEVQEVIAKICPNIKNFIDIGAASGYYAVGVSCKFENIITYAFESNKANQKILLKISELNNVTSKIKIFDKFIGKIPFKLDFANSLFLFDIEGEEYALIDAAFISATAGSHFIIELHGNDQNKINDLITRFSTGNDISFTTANTNKVLLRMSHFDFTENELALLASEGRAKHGKWLLVCPNVSSISCFCSEYNYESRDS